MILCSQRHIPTVSTRKGHLAAHCHTSGLILKAVLDCPKFAFCTCVDSLVDMSHVVAGLPWESLILSCGCQVRNPEIRRVIVGNATRQLAVLVPHDLREYNHA